MNAQPAATLAHEVLDATLHPFHPSCEVLEALLTMSQLDPKAVPKLQILVIYCVFPPRNHGSSYGADGEVDELKIYLPRGKVSAEGSVKKALVLDDS